MAKVLSECSSCHERTLVDERMVARDQYGYYHICEKCVRKADAEHKRWLQGAKNGRKLV